MTRSRFWRWLFNRPGPRYCSACGQQLDYSMLVKRDDRTGEPKEWTWAAACPESSVTFWAGGGWSGNGHVYSHTLTTVAGPPTWAPVMARALTMRRSLRPYFPSGRGELLAWSEAGGAG